MEYKTIKVTCSYQGTNYFGWQRQINKVSLQSTIEKVLFHLWRITIPIIGASRTDAGVHAAGQIFKMTVPITISTDKIAKLFNDHLPDDIHILSAEDCHSSFCPRFNATGKIYDYFISHEKQSCIIAPFVYYCYNESPIEQINTFLQLFVGTHNFLSFSCQDGNENKNTIRTIYSITINKTYNKAITHITFYGKSFLRHMIRRIIGAALYCSKKNLSKEFLYKYLLLPNPANPFYKVPAKGLSLRKVLYANESEFSNDDNTNSAISLRLFLKK